MNPPLDTPDLDIGRPATLEEFQEWVRKTSLYAPGLNYPSATLASESGEVLGCVLKASRVTGRNEVHLSDMRPEAQDNLGRELSDVLWALAAMCCETGLTLQDLANINYDKLVSRQKAGELFSDGLRRFQ